MRPHFSSLSHFPLLGENQSIIWTFCYYEQWIIWTSYKYILMHIFESVSRLYTHIHTHTHKHTHTHTHTHIEVELLSLEGLNNFNFTRWYKYCPPKTCTHVHPPRSAWDIFVYYSPKTCHFQSLNLWSIQCWINIISS